MSALSSSRGWIMLDADAVASVTTKQKEEVRSPRQSWHPLEREDILKTWQHGYTRLVQNVNMISQLFAKTELSLLITLIEHPFDNDFKVFKLRRRVPGSQAVHEKAALAWFRGKFLKLCQQTIIE